MRKTILGCALGMGLLGSVAQAGDIPSDLQAEADKIQTKYFSKCGEDFYGQLPSRTIEEPFSLSRSKPGAAKSPKTSLTFLQFKDLAMHIRTEELSRADQLNGVVWRATVSFTASVQREFNEVADAVPLALVARPQGWSDWTAGFPMVGASMENKQGQIAIKPLSHPALTPSAPSCASVPLQHDMKEEQK